MLVPTLLARAGQGRELRRAHSANAAGLTEMRLGRLLALLRQLEREGCPV